MSNSVSNLTSHVSSLLSLFEINHSFEDLQRAIIFRAYRGLSFEAVIGGAVAEILIETDLSTYFINNLIDQVIDGVRVASLNRSLK